MRYLWALVIILAWPIALAMAVVMAWGAVTVATVRVVRDLIKPRGPV